MSDNVRTRFAPSPTGYMHIGNLRTALYSYLIAKSKGGEFVLRIEDTDQKRYVDGAIDVIYNTLKTANIIYDEGPDIGGKYAPYIQSERVKRKLYMHFASKLLLQGDAYYCFCSECKSDEDQSREECHCQDSFGYDGHCRNLTNDEVDENLLAGKEFVIRQKIPRDIKIKYHDEVYGDLEFDSNVLEDQVLIKRDGYPTYNFANVIDDHLMNITHVVRGCEYLSSTPKYNLLYKAFGWKIPKYIHLPLITRKDENGNVSKLSKRNGSVSFNDFINQGYITEAIINYIGLLGWAPKSNNEFFTLDDFLHQFTVKGIAKAPTLFDENKLKWLNGKHIRKLSDEEFSKRAYDFSKVQNTYLEKHWSKLSSILKNRISTLADIPNCLDFFYNINKYNIDMFNIEKVGLNVNKAKDILNNVKQFVEKDQTNELKQFIYDSKDIKDFPFTRAQILSSLRIALTGKESIVIEILDIIDILGKEETIRRIDDALNKINL